MTSWNSYPKIYNFGHPNTKPLVGRLVRVEEKVDGSQFSFGSHDGKLRCKSRRVEMNPNAPTDLFCMAAYTAWRLFDEGKSATPRGREAPSTVRSKAAISFPSRSSSKSRPAFPAAT